MPKDDLVYAGHMLEMADKAVALVHDKDRGAYDQDEVLRLALTHLVQTVGEAARHVSQEFCDEHPQIPWRAVVGMRHKVVHDYMNVDDDILWDTVTNELPALIDELEKMLPSEGGT
ncbi:DUF86 domain-containing protein [soil metagenome]|jgi:uncharacterized protein with HEPN domain